MSRARPVLFALLALASAGASAVGDGGKFALKGAGFLPCQVFVTEREKKSDTYYLTAGWVEGYISAYNKLSAETFDIASFESLELLLSVMQNHCESHPADRLYSVLGSILAQLRPARLKSESGRVRIAADGRETVLYTETIRRIQAELARRGLYKGDVDGRFTDATRSAVIAFQTDIDFEPTGFPDQTTLWRLLRK